MDTSHSVGNCDKCGKFSTQLLETGDELLCPRCNNKLEDEEG